MHLCARFCASVAQVALRCRPRCCTVSGAAVQSMHVPATLCARPAVSSHHCHRCIRMYMVRALFHLFNAVAACFLLQSWSRLSFCRTARTPIARGPASLAYALASWKTWNASSSGLSNSISSSIPPSGDGGLTMRSQRGSRAMAQLYRACSLSDCVALHPRMYLARNCRMMRRLLHAAGSAAYLATDP